MGVPIPRIGSHAPGAEQRARDTLHRICDLGEEMGVVFTLENLNPIDHPGCPFGSTGAVLSLVSAVDRPQLRINLDLDHTRIGEGDLIRWCEVCPPWIGDVQVADNPGRCEPGTGEINYSGVALALKGMDTRARSPWKPLPRATKTPPSPPIRFASGTGQRGNPRPFPA